MSSFLIAEVVRIRMELAFKHGQDRERYRMGINRLIAEISRFASFVDYTRLQGGNYTNWLRDPDDEPLLATALVGKAQYVVSLNTRVFPPGGIFAGVHYVRPTEFISIVATQYPRKKLREAFETSGYRLP